VLYFMHVNVGVWSFNWLHSALECLKFSAVLPLMQCINSYGSDISKCQFYLDMLNECKRNSGVMGA